MLGIGAIHQSVRVLPDLPISLFIVLSLLRCVPRRLFRNSYDVVTHETSILTFTT